MSTQRPEARRDSPSWAGSDRKERLPADWLAITKVVLRRDDFRCQARNVYGEQCKERATDVDHIKRGDDHRLVNLQALCGWHHDKKTGREAGIEVNKKRKEIRNRMRRTEQHPGLI